MLVGAPHMGAWFGGVGQEASSSCASGDFSFSSYIKQEETILKEGALSPCHHHYKGKKLGLRMLLPAETVQMGCSGDPQPGLPYKASPRLRSKQPVLQDCAFIDCPGRDQGLVIRALTETAEIPAELRQPTKASLALRISRNEFGFGVSCLQFG